MPAPTEEHMAWAAEQYAIRLSAGDAAGVADLFAADAVIEDPIGSPAKIGQATILDFYTGAIERAHPKLTVTGAVRTVPGAKQAAMPFKTQSFFGGKHVEIEIIDVFTFDDDGKFTSMHAFFGPSNIREVTGA